MDRFLTQFGPLVWPLATLLIALIFRRDLSQAIGRIGRVKYRDLELTFRDDLHQAEQLARSIPTLTDKGAVVLEAAPDEAEPLVGRMIVSPSTPDATFERRDPLGNLLAQPREAIEAAWGLVTRAKIRASKHRRSLAPADRDLDALVARLRTLRNRAARPDQPPPSPEDARRFAVLAQQVAARIEELG